MRILQFLGLLIVLYSALTLRIGEVFFVLIPEKITDFILRNPKKSLGAKPVGLMPILEPWAKLMHWFIEKEKVAFEKGKEVLGRYPRQYYPRIYNFLVDILW